MSTTDAGRLGEIKVMAKLTEMGWYPFVDASGKCPVDILAWKDKQIISVQVKSTSTKNKSGNWLVSVGSTRSNRTQNVIHKFDPTSCTYLAVYIAPEDRVAILDASKISVGRQMAVDKYEHITVI